MTQRKKLALIDGHALAFRAFHALRDANLNASSGEPTFAVFGFVQMLLTMLQEQQPEYVAVSFDVGRTFRDDLYAEYKAGRAETPQDFHSQLERIKEFVVALNVPIYTAEGYEADDVIGTLSTQATAHDIETLIMTGDTDTLQLVNDHVKVILANPYGQRTTTMLYDEPKVRERYKGLRPDQLADLRGLKGDASDNIPGVKGIGETGAINLLNEYGTVEALYEHLDDVPKRYRKALDGQRDEALFSKRLSVIVCDAPVTLDLDAARLRDYDRSAVMSLFHKLEFGRSLVQKLPLSSDDGIQEQVLPPIESGAGQQDMFAVATATIAAAPPAGSTQQLALFDLPLADAGHATPLTTSIAPPRPSPFGDYQAVTTEDELGAVINALNAAPGFAFDTESDSLRAIESAVVGISLAIRPGAGWYIPCGHREGEQLPRQRVLDALRPFFGDQHKPKYAHNAKFDIEVLAHAGVEVQGVTFDTMIAAALLGKQRVGLKDLAFYELELSEPLGPITDLIGRGAKQITFDFVPIEQAVPYATADADMTLRLKAKLEQQLAEPDNARIKDIFERLEMPLVNVLVTMERAGIGLNVPYLHELSGRLGERLQELEAGIYEVAGGPFNINSGAQLNEVLFDRLKVPTAGLSKLKSGKYSITAEVLENLSAEHDVAQLILQYRQLNKLKSTYVDALPSLVNQETGRIHTSYNQMGAATGRLSSNDPNLQNIPVRTEEGREIRRGFVAAPGHSFIAADYSQIELRVLAHFTKDENLVQTFQEDRDIHAATASQLFGVPMAQIDKNQRRVAKTVVFGVIYGISSFGLAPRINASRSEAQALIDALFARFPGLRGYIDVTLEEGRRDGYVRSLFGRRRYMPELQHGGNRRQAAEREAINAPIQATAADIMKIAMINVDQALREQQLRTRLLLQVHDELILEAPHDEVATVQTLVRDVMEQAFTLNVPLRVDVETGDNWEEMHNVD